jgi:Methyltransferase domain
MVNKKSFIRTPEETIKLIQETKSLQVAEIGILDGDTSERILSILPKDGTLHPFDYEPHVSKVLARVHDRGYTNVLGYTNSYKPKDSYNWSLMRLIEKHSAPIFDYVYLDGAHTWHVDALCFFLVDRLLKVGGYFDFDDYGWSMEKSPTMNPQIRPQTAMDYTEEQIRERHIALVIDLLVKRDRRYIEIITNKAFRKIV